MLETSLRSAYIGIFLPRLASPRKVVLAKAIPTTSHKMATAFKLFDTQVRERVSPPHLIATNSL